MIVLHDPIKLQIGKSIIKMKDTMDRHIFANYQLIGSGLAPADLLHLTTAPMELFFQEGDMTSLITDNRVTTNQNLKLELINNVVNRISLSDTETMT